jgi:hypothetical protein
MLNKKILAAAIAASLSTGAFAADLDADTTVVTYASELLPETATMEVNANAELDSEVELGFTIGDGTSKYVRFDLVNATFGANVALDVNGTAGVVSSGGEDATFVIFEVPAVGADLPADATVSLTADAFDVSTSETSTIQYRLYETATQAVNRTDLLKDSGVKDLTTTGTGLTGNIFVPADVNSLLEDEFKQFEGPVLTESLGYIDTSLINTQEDGVTANGVLAPATGAQVVAADLITAADEDFTIAFGGDFSFGDWTLNPQADCGGVTTADLDESLDPVAVDVDAATLNGAEHHLCVVVDGDEIINKGSYSATVTSADDTTVDLSGDLGTISYDTITVEVPYVTTFADYNQRLILRNTSSTPVDFTISFSTETGVEANTTGKEAGGTIPANGVLIKKMTDFVMFEGRTRGSATVEIEGLEANIQAAMQTVNAEDGATDTVILNANSVTAFVPQVP